MILSDFKTLVLEKIGDEWFRDGIDVSLKIVLTIVIFVCFYFSAQLLQKSLRAFARGRKPHVREVFELLSKALRITLIIIGAITALGTAGVDVGALVASLGLTGFALSLAFKDILSNVLSGVLILFYRPFHIGDIISVAAHSGKIISIDLRYTTLKKDNERILIPNASLLSGTITIQDDSAEDREN